VATPCGSHTASGIPDLANDRLLSTAARRAVRPDCRGIDLIEVPLSDPAAAEYLRFVRSGDPSGSYVEIDAPSSAAGTYGSAEAGFGPTAPVEGISGEVALVDDGTGTDRRLPGTGGLPRRGDRAGAARCLPVHPEGPERPGRRCGGRHRVQQRAGAPITMGGTNDGVTIPSVMVSLDDGLAIVDGLPATGTRRQLPDAGQPRPALSRHRDHPR
jgi:hypothetical protein